MNDDRSNYNLLPSYRQRVFGFSYNGRFEVRLIAALIGIYGFCFAALAQDTIASVNLDHFIEQAITSSPLLKDYNNQLLVSTLDSMQINASYLPQVTASSTTTYAPVVKGYGYDEVITNGQSLDALLTVNYELTGRGLRNNRTQGVLLRRDSIQYASMLSQLELKKAITEQYITTYASQQQVEFNRDIYRLLKDEETLLKELTRANAYRQTEYLTFLVTFKQQQLQYKQAETQFKNDFSTLNYLSGINDTTTAPLEEPLLNKVIATLLHETFFTKRFQIDSLRVVNEKDAIDFNYKPKASVYVNGGYNSSLILQPYKNFGTSIGFTLSMPIYDGHQKKMEHNKLDLFAQTSAAYRDFFVKQHKQQIDLLKQQIDATEALYQQIEDQIKFTKSLIEVDSKLLATGDVKIADFVIAINNYMAAQNLYRQTSITRLKLINQLNYWNR